MRGGTAAVSPKWEIVLLQQVMSRAATTQAQAGTSVPVNYANGFESRSDGTGLKCRMSDSHVAVRIHLIFSTKERRASIPVEMQPRLWAYMHGIARRLGCTALEIGGMADHVHLLVEISPKVTVSELAQKIKANSSRWMHENGRALFAWQAGYAAFSVSESHVQMVREYIRTQAEHHKKRDYRAEMEALFRKHGIDVASLRDSNCSAQPSRH
ncbi:MAG: IS200/IS605 family transposase [Acidobacteriaceae bacterium]